MTENPLPVRKRIGTRPALRKGRRAREVRFIETFGCPGVAAIILIFFVCFSHIMLVWYYSAGFRNFSRPEMTFNYLCAGSFLVYGVFILLSWKKMAKKKIKQHLTVEKKLLPEVIKRKTHSRGSNKKIVRIDCFHRLSQAKKSVGIQGPYYLSKVILLEIVASGNCIFNLLTLYLCILPSAAVVIYCLFEVVEGSFRLYTITIARATVRIRYLRLQVAIVSDVLLSVVPMIIIALNFSKIAIGDMFQMTFLPSIMLLSKTRSFLRETINQRTAQIARDDNRESISRVNIVLQIDEMVVMQTRNVPRCVVWGMRIVTVLFILLMTAVVAMVLVATSSARTKCEKTEHGLFVWDRCTIKVPLCHSWFNPSCNCADLKIVGHNFTVFPEVINSMSGLRRVAVTHGPLEHMGNDFGLVSQDLSVLSLDHNRLPTLPKGLEQAHRLHTLYASFNRLRYIPSKLWSLPNLYAIDLSSNLLDFRNIALNAPSLHYLLLQNNSGTKIPDSLTYNNCPNLVNLDMAGNRLTHISKEVGTFHRTLVELVLSRNNLTGASFPEELQSLFLSSRLDVRNNSIASLPRWFEHIIGPEFYIADNPICSNDWKLSSACPPSLKSALENSRFGCSRQCSPFCNNVDLDREVLGAVETCIPGCNSKVCGYSNGGCSFPTSG